MVEGLALIFPRILLWMTFSHEFSSSWRTQRTLFSSLNAILSSFTYRSSCQAELQYFYVRDAVVNLFDECLSQVVLGVTIYRFVFTEDSIEDTWRLFIIDFSFLSEVDASDPLMLYFFEGRLDLENGGQFVEEVPEYLILSIEIVVFGCLADVVETFEFSVALLYFEVLIAFFVRLVLFLLGLGICLFRWHKYNWLIL